MTTIPQIITDAYREGNLISVGTQETSAEQEEGLRLLNRFVLALFGNELGENLQSVSVGDNNVSHPAFTNEDFRWAIDNWFSPLNVRLILNLTEPKTVNLHPNPADGARVAFVDASKNLSPSNSFTLVGNGRTVEEQPSLVFSTGGAAEEWFYRADLGDWKRVTNLTVSDDSPFPREFDDLLVIGLAIRLSTRHGVPISGESGQAYGKLLRDFKSRYLQSRQEPSELALSQTLGTRYWDSLYSDLGSFTRGIARW